MEVSESTLNKIGRALTKAASKFPEGAEPLPLTDILIQVKQESGELLVFDDDDKETIADLYVVDDDTIVLSGQFLEGLQEDLDAFWEELEKE